MALSSEFLGRFFDRLNYSEAQHPKDPLQLLTALQEQFIVQIPFETLELHYSVAKDVSLQIADIYDKVVTRKRGGYCHELNTLMAAVLRAMGYQLFTVVCRFWNPRAEPPQYRPISHMANIVTIDGVKYLVDVGCGVQGPSRPLPLVPGAISPGLPSQELKLEHQSLAIHSDDNQRVWVFYQRSNSGAWQEIYNFAETEFFPADFDILNYYTIKCSPFSRMVLVQQFLRDKESGKLNGTIILLDDKITIKVGGGDAETVSLQSEQERIKAFAEHFSIDLTDEERGAIATPLRSAIECEA